MIWRVLTTVTGFLFILCGGVRLKAQAPSSAVHSPSTAPLSYEAVSIKPDDTDNSYWRNTADSFSVGSMPVLTLIQAAFGVQGEQIVGAPRWAKEERFAIQAKTDAGTTAALEKLPPMVRFERVQGMIQSLLADRFALKVHHETQTLPIYELRVAKSGSKIKKSPSESGGNANYANGQVEAQSVSMWNFAQNMSRFLGRVVVDKTGLAGGYDFTLKWTPEGAEATDERPSIFTAFEEQLGLELIPAKEPADVLVIDHLERPSPN